VVDDEHPAADLGRREAPPGEQVRHPDGQPVAGGQLEAEPGDVVGVERSLAVAPDGLDATEAALSVARPLLAVALPFPQSFPRLTSARARLCHS